LQILITGAHYSIKRFTFAPIQVKIDTGMWSFTANMKPLLSVVVVSDYVPDTEKETAFLERCLLALSNQNCEEEFEVIVVLPEGSDGSVAQRALRACPSAQVVETDSLTSFQMKNDGAAKAKGEIIAFLDGDCFATPGFARAAIEVMNENPEYDAMTGNTFYEEDELAARSFCLISRALLNASEVGPSHRLANHNCAIRRDVFLKFPFPEKTTPFGGTVYARQLIENKIGILHNPAMSACHVYEGWERERDIRRNNGYAGIAQRIRFENLPYSWIVRLGYLAIPILYFARLSQSWWMCLSRHSQYGIRWYQLPFTMLLAPVAFFMEIPGMIAALNGKPLSDTAYR
jgi:glycosyltransferase involved in cell wall biosynthesis